MTFSKTNFRKPLLILPVLLAIGFMFATPMILDVAAAKGGNGNNGGSSGLDNALLPDISPSIPKHLQIQNTQQQEFLRFTNAWGNIGVGNLEYEPVIPIDNPNEAETQDALQNLFDADGNMVFSEIVSEFEFHEVHNHWHIADIGEFAIRYVATDAEYNEIPGDVVVLPNGVQSASIKVGFCIADVYKWNGKNSPTSQRTYWDCEVELQGIQVGWMDQYHQSVEGNEVPMTDIPNGEYFLTHTWNPLNRFVDGNEDNNMSWMKFELSDDGNGNRKITELDGFAPECKSDGTTPGFCGEISRNN